MNRYLLLRDNKQTGPYTVAEIIQKGIKAYDLVWLDGKSAAWRYPSEIEELKAYAPVVEEQPFDRFYKKPVAEKHFSEIASSLYDRPAQQGKGSSLQASTEKLPSEQREQAIERYATPQMEQPEQAIERYATPQMSGSSQTALPIIENNNAVPPVAQVTSTHDIPHHDVQPVHSTFQPVPQAPATDSKEAGRKIYVTLPGSTTSARSQRDAALTNNPIAQPAKEAQPVKEVQADRITERPVAKVSSSREQYLEPPTPPRAEPPSSERFGSAPKYRKIEGEYKRSEHTSPGFSGQLSNSDILTDTVLPVRNRKGLFSGKQNVAVTIMAAICLLLGGIIIGLVISNSRKESARELNALVKQIQDREKVRTQPVTQPVARTEAADQIITESSTAAPESQTRPGSTKPEPSAKLPAKLAVNKQANQVEVKPEQASITVPTPQEPAIRIQPAIQEDKAPLRAAVESTRKNIRQLVSVKPNAYKTGVLGGISDLSLTVSNKSDFELDQVQVQVEFLGPEKRVVKTQVIVFNNVKAGDALTLDVPKTNRGVTINTSIKSINSKSLGLASAGM